MGKQEVKQTREDLLQHNIEAYDSGRGTLAKADVLTDDTILSDFGFRTDPNKLLLDVGCGNGWVLSNYAESSAKVTGIDISEVAVKTTRKRFKLQGLKGKFHVGDAENLAFAGTSSHHGHRLAGKNE